MLIVLSARKGILAMTFNINKHIQPAAASATVSALLRCRSAGQPSIRHRALPLAISAVLGIGLQTTAVAQAFPAVIELAELDGSNGFVLIGETADDYSGRSVASAGDVNGDGIDDLIVGAPSADANGNEWVGRSYVVFGSATGLPNPFNLSSLDGSNGFILNGEAAYDRSGYSVAGGGDVNGDGIDDLIVGTFFAHANGIDRAGRSYVVFGSAASLPNPFDLSSLDGSNGFVLNGEAANDRSGISVASAGDVNGDGTDDLFVGADRVDVNGNEDVGHSYVVFGNNRVFFDGFENEELDTHTPSFKKPE